MSEESMCRCSTRHSRPGSARPRRCVSFLRRAAAPWRSSTTATKGGKLKYCYNLLGIDYFYAESEGKIPAGDHQVRMEFAYAGGGLGKGGTVTRYIDGKKVGTGKVAATAAMIFSADDGCDVGVDTAAPVSPDYEPRGNEFKGRVKGCADRDCRRGREFRPPGHSGGRPAHRDGAAVRSGRAGSVAM